MPGVSDRIHGYGERQPTGKPAPVATTGLMIQRDAKEVVGIGVAAKAIERSDEFPLLVREVALQHRR